MEALQRTSTCRCRTARLVLLPQALQSAHNKYQCTGVPRPRARAAAFLVALWTRSRMELLLHGSAVASAVYVVAARLALHSLISLLRFSTVLKSLAAASHSHGTLPFENSRNSILGNIRKSSKRNATTQNKRRLAAAMVRRVHSVYVNARVLVHHHDNLSLHFPHPYNTEDAIID